MAPSRKAADPDAPPPRRSGRTSTTAAAAGAGAVKAAAADAVEAAKPVVEKAAQAVKDVVKEVEKLTEEPVKEYEDQIEVKEAEAYGVGEVVDDVELVNENGEATSLAKLYADTGLVIFSYPKANTPGCTTQACNFRDDYATLQALGFTPVGLSSDPPKAQLTWKTSKSFPYSLLSDPKRVLLDKLGSTQAKKRCSWVVAKGGKLLQANIGVKPADDSKNAIEFIKSLA